MTSQHSHNRTTGARDDAHLAHQPEIGRFGRFAVLTGTALTSGIIVGGIVLTASIAAGFSAEVSAVASGVVTLASVISTAGIHAAFVKWRADSIAHRELDARGVDSLPLRDDDPNTQISHAPRKAAGFMLFTGALAVRAAGLGALFYVCASVGSTVWFEGPAVTWIEQEKQRQNRPLIVLFNEQLDEEEEVIRAGLEPLNAQLTALESELATTKLDGRRELIDRITDLDTKISAAEIEAANQDALARCEQQGGQREGCTGIAGEEVAYDTAVNEAAFQRQQASIYREQRERLQTRLDGLPSAAENRAALRTEAEAVREKLEAQETLLQSAIAGRTERLNEMLGAHPDASSLQSTNVFDRLQALSALSQALPEFWRVLLAMKIAAICIELSGILLSLKMGPSQRDERAAFSRIQARYEYATQTIEAIDAQDRRMEESFSLSGDRPALRSLRRFENRALRRHGANVRRARTS